MKVIIVGGVAGGASCAARLRRLDESAEIIVVERGPYISYANCGLPYYVGGLIPRESKLVLADAALFRAQLNVEVRTLCEAVSISPEARTVQLRDVASGEVTTESYDTLVLSPGASPIRPPLPGIDLPGIFEVRTVPDVHVIREWMEGHVTDPSGLDTYTGSQTVLPARRAVVVGGGFIGLEMAENLVHLGLDVTLVQRGPQLMSPMDPEMARYVERHVARNGVTLALNENVTGFRQAAGSALEVLTESGRAIPADIVVMGIGVRPEVALAKTAGVEIGERGGILVDDQMRTSVPGHLRRGRRRRGEGPRDRRPVARRPGRPGQPPGPHRRRGDRRARLALPGDPGHGHRRASSAGRPPGRASARRRCAGSATRTTRRSTSTRTRTPATTPARSTWR